MNDKIFIVMLICMANLLNLGCAIKAIIKKEGSSAILGWITALTWSLNVLMTMLKK